MLTYADACEGYLEMYRSMEPDFGKTLQGVMLGTVDKALEEKKAKQKVCACVLHVCCVFACVRVVVCVCVLDVCYVLCACAWLSGCYQ
jgi:hypothetical protein